MSPFKASAVAQNAEIAAILGVSEDTVRRKRDLREKKKELVAQARERRRAARRKKRYIAGEGWILLDFIIFFFSNRL